MKAIRKVQYFLSLSFENRRTQKHTDKRDGTGSYVDTLESQLLIRVE